MFFPVIALLFSALAYIVSAAPVVMRLTTRDVWAPPITLPRNDTIWVAGSTVLVTWNTSTRPAEVTNPVGNLLLGFIESNGGENLNVDHPLAQGFNLSDGSVNITVPNVNDGNNYVVALIGDSGNISPQFRITH